LQALKAMLGLPLVPIAIDCARHTQARGGGVGDIDAPPGQALTYSSLQMFAT
jgi:hypothetical protein